MAARLSVYIQKILYTPLVDNITNYSYPEEAKIFLQKLLVIQAKNYFVNITQSLISIRNGRLHPEVIAKLQDSEDLHALNPEDVEMPIQLARNQ